jgi:photosystem II stability/assembly factor-like uncharacterized protein
MVPMAPAMARLDIASRRLRRSGRLLTGLCIAAFVTAIVGCSREAGAPVSPSPNGASATPAACMAAQLRGELIQQSNAIIGLRDDADVVHTVIWPDGYAVDDTATAIIDDRGQPVANVGDSVEIGGGETPGRVWLACAGTIRIVSASIIDARLMPSGMGWLLSTAGLKVSADAGRHWDIAATSRPDPRAILDVDIEHWPIGHVVVHHLDSAAISVFATSDAGKSWSEGPQFGDFPDGLGGGSIQFLDASRGFVSVVLPSSSAGSAGRLYSTTDGGATWSPLQMPAGGPVQFMDLDNGWLLGGPLHNELYRTADAGTSWSLVEIAVPDEAIDHRTAPAIPSEDNGRLVTPVQFFINGGGPLLFAAYESSDAGTSWARTSDIFKLAEEGVQRASAVAGSNWVIAAGGLLVSTDGGHSFASHAAPPVSDPPLSDPYLSEVFVSTEGSIWVVLNESGCRAFKSDCWNTTVLWASDDLGGTWSQLTP